MIVPLTEGHFKPQMMMVVILVDATIPHISPSGPRSSPTHPPEVCSAENSQLSLSPRMSSTKATPFM